MQRVKRFCPSGQVRRLNVPMQAAQARGPRKNVHHHEATGVNTGLPGAGWFSTIKIFVLNCCRSVANIACDFNIFIRYPGPPTSFSSPVYRSKHAHPAGDWVSQRRQIIVHQQALAR